MIQPGSFGPETTHPQTSQPETSRLVPRRHLLIGVVALAVVLLVAGSIGLYVVLRGGPRQPTTVVDDYLTALRGGDVTRAVDQWDDLPGAAGLPSLHVRLRAYLNAHRDEYRTALANRTWQMSEVQARLGPGIEVKISEATVTYLLVRDNNQNWLIFLGPEDTFGLSDPDNPLLTLG
jgi:hypothetical protein